MQKAYILRCAKSCNHLQMEGVRPLYAQEALVVNSLCQGQIPEAPTALHCYHSAGILSLDSKGNTPKANSASRCTHRRVELWSSLRLKPCQYKSCKMLSSICSLISALSFFHSSIRFPRCCGGEKKYFWSIVLREYCVSGVVQRTSLVSGLKN